MTPTFPDLLLDVLAAPDELAKGAAVRICQENLEANRTSWQPWPDDLPLPKEPPRPTAWASAQKMGRRRHGIANPHTRKRFLHALHHIELSAIDLAIACCLRAPHESPDFHHDFLSIAADEVKHAILLRDYLTENNYPPGSEAIEHRLWGSMLLARDLGEQLVIVPRFLEARGLDVSAELLPRLQEVDARAGEIVERIYRDEIRHVGIGSQWHDNWCTARGQDPRQHFATTVDHWFGDQIPSAQPLDEEGRKQAGFTHEEIAYLRDPGAFSLREP